MLRFSEYKKCPPYPLHSKKRKVYLVKMCFFLDIFAIQAYSQFKICFERLNLIEKMLLFTVVTSFFCYLIGISRFYHFIGSKILGNIFNFISKRQELQKMLNTYKMTRYTIVKSVKFPIKWYIFLPYKNFFRGSTIFLQY